jgi:hypothetical protein
LGQPPADELGEGFKAELAQGIRNSGDGLNELME